ncbi:MAG: hypothetical protein K2P58_08680 [Hyphomonadaceae bacterium]|nr:hypothetical protein [Hyphomonadaceae bacterium]
MLLLHGRTGCGKSSFLHAGVKPFLARTGSPISFAQARDGFSVVRSTADPLRAVGSALLEIADSFIDPESNPSGRVFGRLASDVDPASIEAAFPKDAKFRESVQTSATAAFSALNTLARAMRTPPIIVIDQAEEIFTLKPRRDLSQSGSEASRQALAEERRDREYFRFIQMVASRDARTRLVVSLRTEYKGLFDDHIAKHGHAGEDLRGFHLRDLDVTALQQAILRPTLRNGPEWQRLKAKLDLDDAALAPGDASDALRISSEAALELAKGLLSERVPVGGVLPTLQAACIRLWEQSKLARERRGGRHEIDVADLRRLGEIENQVEEYLQEQIERQCSRVEAWRDNLPEKVSIWLGALRDLLVRVEADGRAVTNSIELNALTEEIASRLPGGKSNVGAVTERLKELRDPISGILKPDQDNITLGHDSLALALNKWSLATPRDSKMMMRMGMATMHRLRELRREDLFLDDDLPHETTVISPVDFNWDRQLPHFAQARGFAERLGIRIASDAKLDARRDLRRKWNWEALREALIEREQSWGAKRRWNGGNERVMVAAEFAAFPGKPEAAENSTAEAVGPAIYAWRWSDLLVCNLFVGNALVGPNPKFAERIVDAMKVSEATNAAKDDAVQNLDAPDQFVEELKAVVVSALEEVLRSGGEIKCANASGRQLLVLAAKICCRPDLAKEFAKLTSLTTLENAVYDVADPLIEHLLDGDTRFIVGSAASRAMARQCGFHPYFGAKEIAILAHKEMKRRQGVDRLTNRQIDKKEKDRRRELPDLAAAVQETMAHTVWNISVPAATWRQGLNRAFILRLASLGYFTSEYVRTSMDDFIGYIHEFVNQSFLADTRGENAMSGQRQMRYAIKEAIADCYTFLRFDEFGPAIFDLDSLYAYWSEHGQLRTRSVAGEIYNELVMLRQRTLAHYQICAEAIAWMRYGRTYDPSHEDISRAYKLKELAWNNFNIYNFYDAERYMSRAADELRGCMERDFQRKDAGVVQ